MYIYFFIKIYAARPNRAVMTSYTYIISHRYKHYNNYYTRVTTRVANGPTNFFYFTFRQDDTERNSERARDQRRLKKKNCLKNVARASSKPVRHIGTYIFYYIFIDNNNIIYRCRSWYDIILYIIILHDNTYEIVAIIIIICNIIQSV